jgi:FKBP-type peptidyl-prolyl cis-trans isomerase FklB
VALVAGAAMAAPAEMTDEQKKSYAIGANVGRNLKQQGISLDPELVAKGLVEEMSGKSRLTDTEVATFIQQFQNEVKQKKEADRQKAAEENQKRGAAFQAEYAKREGVKTLPGGILYRVLQEGTGDKPTAAEYVRCNYRGTLVDGKQFDASPPGKLATFNLDKIIRGWQVALKEMPAGSKWEIVMPAEMAYGARGAAPAIGPNETLIFEVELVDFE